MKTKKNKGLVDDAWWSDELISRYEKAINYGLSRTGYGDCRRFARAVLYALSELYPVDGPKVKMPETETDPSGALVPL